MKSSFKIVISTFFLIVACSDGDKKDRFDQTLLLANLEHNVIIPAYQQHKVNINLMVSAAEVFTLNTTIENLEAFKNAWVTATLSWKKAEIFNFGPVDDLSIETSMDLWPTSATGIENAVAAYDQSPTYLDGVGSNKKGLPAIEYLLFHSNNETIISEFSGDAKRRGYINALTNDLAKQADLLVHTWEGTYGDEFVENTGTTSGTAPVLVSNQLLLLLKEVKNYKIGIPFGVGSAQGVQPESVESWYAGKSLEFIGANLDAIELVFTGGDGVGFDDYLDSVPVKTDGNQPLSKVIKLQIVKCRSSYSGITVPLEEAITTQSYQVEQLLTDLNLLNAYLEADMMSRLHLVITFTDNDGD